MLSEYEAQELTRRMRRVDTTLRIAWKCAAGLLILVAVAAFGSTVYAAPDAHQSTAAAADTPA